jgi:hypothetical protein
MSERLVVPGEFEMTKEPPHTPLFWKTGSESWQRKPVPQSQTLWQRFKND